MRLRVLIKVGLAVLGLGGMAVALPPYVAAALSAGDADGASDAVASALSEGRDQAMRLGRPVEVLFDASQRSIEVQGGRWRKLQGSATMSAPAAGQDGRSVVNFFPDGSSSGGQVVVFAGGQAWWLMVDGPTGGVRRIHAVAR
ncbi:MAG: GspH/FimT family pseudopilin [Solirubrobacterales bacterium]